MHLDMAIENGYSWKYLSSVLFRQQLQLAPGHAKTLYHIRFSETPIEELKRIVEQNDYSAITIYKDYDHAILRKFNHQLTVDHCEPIEGYNCSTFIYRPPKDFKDEVSKKKVVWQISILARIFRKEKELERQEEARKKAHRLRGGLLENLSLK